MVLHVNKSTSKWTIYSELGRPPLVIQIEQRMANFWIKLAQGKDSKLSVIMYILLLNLSNNSEYESPWIKTVQHILYESGLSNLSHFPNVVNHKCLNNCLTIRLHAEYIQTWLSNVFYNDNCITYRIFRDVFEFKPYLTLLPERLRIVLLNLGWVTQNCLLKQADGSIWIAMKGIVLWVTEMRLEMDFIYCFNVTL